MESDARAMAEMWLVVGLGNPGPEYAETRHNLGFNVIEALDETLGVEVKQRKFSARIGDRGCGRKEGDPDEAVDVHESQRPAGGHGRRLLQAAASSTDGRGG